jgi:hypothetical protein
MRTALLAAYQKTSAGDLRADLLLAGRSMLGWQVALASLLSCERIIVLAGQRSPGIIAAQQEAEDAGIPFQIMSGFERLPALLKADDELLILGDGVIGDQQLIKAILARNDRAGLNDVGVRLRKAVICLPADAPHATSFPNDFERVDATRCWAGVLLMQAASVQQLSDFPPESNAISLLLRLALQSGTECHTLAPEETAPERWLLAHDPSTVNAHEQALLVQHRAVAEWNAPGAALADRFTATIGVSGLATGEPAAMLTGSMMLLAAIALAIWGYALPAVILAAMGCFAFDTAAGFSRLKQALLQVSPHKSLELLREPGRDVLASLVLMFALAPPSGLDPIAALAPLAIGAARLVSGSASARPAAFWRDRSLHFALLALAAAFDTLAQGAAIFALAAVAHALFIQRNQSFPQ